ncbi:MAG TPA: pirin family protein [Kofleriaceae bacterium]|nr:pirin family protein [Kofleriaceae bacterium]
MIETVVSARRRSVGTLAVARVLPSVGRRSVGPFTFLDHIGPVDLDASVDADVRPHPHIGLATVTYLFDGEFVHRDSLGSVQAIRPGAINWMNAGRGIAHSERLPPERKAGRLHGIQLWVALPTAHEESEPVFRHHPADALPTLDIEGVAVRLLVGSAYRARSPVATVSPMYYAEVDMGAGDALPMPDDQPERAAYVVEGSVTCGDRTIRARELVVFRAGADPWLTADSAARVMLLGGQPVDGARHIWWNFVSSSRERIEQAKRDWAAGRFAAIPGDDDPVPLPEA